jgi:hypothetical protein
MEPSPRGDKRGVRFTVLAAASLVLCACAAPGETAQQAGAIASIAAEGSLLAHDVAGGDTTRTFTRVHAGALRAKLAELEPKVTAAELDRLLSEVDAALAALAGPAGERDAGSIERRLEELSKRADERAG